MSSYIFFSVLNILLTAIMLGVILVTQFIHYPAFLSISFSDFTKFHLQHTKVMGYIAGPLMLGELFLAIWGIIYFREIGKWLLVINLVLVAFLWGVTFIKSVPLHGILSHGQDLIVIHQLILSNWLRTIAWFLKTMLAVAIFYFAAQL